MQSDDLVDENRFGPCNVPDRLAGHWVGQEANEIAGMAGLHCNADFAVGFKAADSGSVPRAGIDHDEWTALQIDFHSSRRNDTHESIIHRPLEVPSVDD